jgi:DNA-binding MarR family transcriptional regulator
MDERILIGQGREIREVPAAAWKQHLALLPEHGNARLSFMTQAHHRVRNFVVLAIADRQQPLTPDYIAGQCGLEGAQVAAILDELEQKLFFLARDPQGDVSWAYPVTVEPTPHRLQLSTGQRLYAA